MRSHESIYVFSKSGSYYNRVDISGNFTPFEAKAPESIKTIRVYKVKKQHQESNDGTKRCALSVIKSPHATQPGRHPTEKPVELYKFLIERYCPAGGTVLDPTFGSGNSGLACQLLGRNYIGIEKDKTFFDKALSKLLGS
jgi:site-specific DNA-methyltransferase (adenine-specific)